MNDHDEQMTAPIPRPAAFAPFFRVLAEIAREQAIERRSHLRLIIEVANEIEHDEPPPPPLRTGVEMMGGHTWIDAASEVQ
ncbi:MAG TPA: hypothetical protein VIG44_03370 [Thermomicrobiales bacterium]